MKHLRHLLFALSFLLLQAAPAATVAATGVELALEPRLSYLRVHRLPDDLPAATAPAAGTLVLDLRFVHADPAATAAFGDWLKTRARPRSPVLVLINSETEPGLLVPLSPPLTPAGVVSIGPAIGRDLPDVALTVDPAADRAAYEALDHGTPVGELIEPKIEKVRHDEAAMARERATANDPDAEDATPAANAPPPKPVPAPLIDRVLQRAVQLSHALVALKKV